MLNVKETNEEMTILYLETPTLEVPAEVDENQQSYIWYGGEMATLKTSGFQFHLEANGDVRGRLYERSANGDYSYESMLEDVVDKRNQGIFGEVLSQYIKDDQELEQLFNDEHPKYYLDLGNNNWWECFITDPDGNWHDLMWDLDSCGFKEALDEMLTTLNQGLEYEEGFFIKFKQPVTLDSLLSSQH